MDGMRRARQPRLKPLLDDLAPGFLADTRWLRSRGIDPKSIHGYVERGWLEHLVRGVYRRPPPLGTKERDYVPWESVVLSLQRIMNYDVHIGGVNSLELHGHIHYLYFRGMPFVHLYGEVPAWLKRLPTNTTFRVHSRKLFGNDMTGIAEARGYEDPAPPQVESWRWLPVVSTPERAFLEALDEIRDVAFFDDVEKRFEGMDRLRPHHLMDLLVACRSVKVRRLFFAFADYQQHPWLEYLDKSAIDFGSGPRALGTGGVIHPEYRITVPQEYLEDDDDYP